MSPWSAGVGLRRFGNSRPNVWQPTQVDSVLSADGRRPARLAVKLAPSGAADKRSFRNAEFRQRLSVPGCGRAFTACPREARRAADRFSGLGTDDAAAARTQCRRGGRREQAGADCVGRLDAPAAVYAGPSRDHRDHLVDDRVSPGGLHRAQLTDGAPVGPARGHADNSPGLLRSLNNDWHPVCGFHDGPERCAPSKRPTIRQQP